MAMSHVATHARCHQSLVGLPECFERGGCRYLPDITILTTVTIGTIRTSVRTGAPSEGRQYDAAPEPVISSVDQTIVPLSGKIPVVAVVTLQGIIRGLCALFRYLNSVARFGVWNQSDVEVQAAESLEQSVLWIQAQRAGQIP